jgi:hypothetical protein
MAATKEGRPMHPTFEAAHQAFVDDYLALYHGFPKYLEYLVLGFGWGETPDGQRWFIISPDPKGLQHLTYPELMEWNHESFEDLPELIAHARLDDIVA